MHIHSRSITWELNIETLLSNYVNIQKNDAHSKFIQFTLSKVKKNKIGVVNVNLRYAQRVILARF